MTPRVLLRVLRILVFEPRTPINPDRTLETSGTELRVDVLKLAVAFRAAGVWLMPLARPEYLGGTDDCCPRFDASGKAVLALGRSGSAICEIRHHTACRFGVEASHEAVVQADNRTLGTGTEAGVPPERDVLLGAGPFARDAQVVL